MTCLPCLSWFKTKKPLRRDFNGLYSCSCDLCGRNFDTVSELVTHTGFHRTDDINRKLLMGHGTVRCNTCWRRFRNCALMVDHKCVIRGLTPINSNEDIEANLLVISD